jgi:hypothetical protein
MFTQFTCNICGAGNEVSSPEAVHRELAPCTACGSNARFRAMMVGLSLGLHQRIMPMQEWPADRSVRGFGCSDSAVYARKLENLYDYTNTFLDAVPAVDLCDATTLAPLRSCRFILCSDVLEHVLCRPGAALANMWNCLMEGGCLVLSAPTYAVAESVEKYPTLRSYKVVPIAGRHAVVYETMAGQLGFDPEPVFHGGPGSVLEMRLFGHAALLRTIGDNGFNNVSEIGAEALPYGAVWPSVVERDDLPFPMNGRVIVAVK